MKYNGKQFLCVDTDATYMSSNKIPSTARMELLKSEPLKTILNSVNEVKQSHTPTNIIDKVAYARKYCFTDS